LVDTVASESGKEFAAAADSRTSKSGSTTVGGAGRCSAPATGVIKRRAMGTAAGPQTACTADQDGRADHHDTPDANPIFALPAGSGGFR